MSALLGVFGAPGAAADPRQAARMLGAMASRGADRSAVRRIGTVVLAAARHAWELDAALSGSVIVVQQDDVAVAADASLFYRADLVRKLRERGVRPLGDSPSQLILSAYLTWGVDCARELEGDFAFVVWDARTRSVFAARDFTGKRPLFYAQVGDGLLVASSIAALEAHPECPRELDLAVLAEEVGALTGSETDTCWKGIQRLAPGHSLWWRAGEPVHTAAWWPVPEFSDSGGVPFDDAAAELRALLLAAMNERMAATGPTALCLSGGWDSPSLFGVGRELLRSAGDTARRLEPISISFPPGDPGREDDVISSIVAYWKADTTWLRSDDIPPLDDLLERAAHREEPFPHPFELMNRALARTGRSLGTRIVLDGNGGDQLFQVSTAYLTDLFSSGRWPSLAREWQAQGGGGWRSLLGQTVLPSLPAGILHRMAAVGGKAARAAMLERRPPPWMSERFVREHRLLERERLHVPARGDRSHSAYETAWQLTRPLVGRMTALLGTFAMEEGVEHRSPFTDSRVLAFAAARPVTDRRSGRETKRLLRRAVKGLLPEAVLAPRPYRTGSPIRYLTGAIRSTMPSLIERTMKEPVLGDLGILDPKAFRQSWDDSVRHDDQNLCVSLYLTMEVELWLRARAAHDVGEVRRSQSAGTRLAIVS
ncbi:MAG TPA: asparagine synthase-related protein [Gemmatimonadaceae bacterium]|nr:asparagine synthase-related protein [Gemmatimonadaceae bacterium]